MTDEKCEINQYDRRMKCRNMATVTVGRRRLCCSCAKLFPFRAMPRKEIDKTIEHHAKRAANFAFERIKRLSR